MIWDKVMEGKNTFCVFVKNDIRDVNEDFFKQVRNTECTEDMCHGVSLFSRSICPIHPTLTYLHHKFQTFVSVGSGY